MFKNIFFSVILSFFYCKGFSQVQKIETTLLNSIETNQKEYVGTDGLGNNYYIHENVLIKQNTFQIWEYKNVAYGKISSVNIINPLKLIVFYENFQMIILLDNQLNETQKINLADLNNGMVVSKVGMATQNRLWIYDSSKNQINLYNYLNNSLSKIGNPLQEETKLFQSDFNNFYWINETNNWYAINIFGKSTFLANIPPFDSAQIIDDEKLLFAKNDSLYYLNNKTKVIYEIEIVEKSIQNFYYKDQILSIFTNQQIKNFKIKLP